MKRKDAAALGLKQYTSDTICKAGHNAPRWTSTGGCTACVLASTAAWKASGAAARWREENADRIRAQQAQYRSARQEQRAEAARAYYAAHTQERAEYQQRYLRENRDAVYARLHKRRARKRCAIPLWYGELDELAFQEAADLAARRGAITGAPWHIDHMIPLLAKTACGLHWHLNIQVIPGRLNAKKSNRMVLTTPLEWLRHL